MGLFSWFFRARDPLSHFETPTSYIPPLDSIALETLEGANSAYLEGLSLLQAGDYAGAVEKYTAAIEILPSYWEALDNRGLCKMRLEQFAAAIPDFERSGQINRESPLAFVALIRCYQMTNQHRKAYMTTLYCVQKWRDKSPFPDWDEWAKRPLRPPSEV